MAPMMVMDSGGGGGWFIPSMSFSILEHPRDVAEMAIDSFFDDGFDSGSLLL